MECGNALLKKGYRIKIFNTINFKKSMHYNPFAYIHSEKDILKLVTTLIANTKGEGKGGDEFWEKSEKLLYTALIAYIHYEAPQSEQNFASLLELLNAMEVREDDEEFQNPVDLMFEDLNRKKPNTFAYRQYRLYKLAAGKTAKSILISCGARLAPFDIAELREITDYDELELDTLGDRKTALFLIMSDTDATFNFLISMIYTQLFNLLCEKADDVYGGRLPVHVRCLIDEAANIGQIPNLEKLVATIRSREISACLVLQARSQLKAIYKDNADTIIGNMDSQIFLGGSEPTTLKELNAALGKETIDTFNTSDTRGNSPSYGTNFQKLGHELYTMMRYLQSDTLREKGWSHFDCWAAHFGETKTVIELAPEGTGYRARTRFAKFYNLPELINIWKEAADVKTADQLHLPRPEAVYHNEVAKPTPEQQELVSELSDRAAKVHSGTVEPREDNMLKITSDGRKLGLDQRIINPDLPDEQGTKINMCVENILRIWRDGEADKLTQLVFCDSVAIRCYK